MKVIKIVFLFLASLTAARAQVSVFGKVDHIKPDGIDTVGGIALTVSGSTAPYTYTWNPGAITTKDIANKTAGQYTVNVKSASSQTYTGIYRIGYKVEWTNLNRAIVRNDTLFSTVDNASSISSSISKNTLPANTNGWFEYVIPALYATGADYYIGFTGSISGLPNSTNDISYGIYYWGQTQDIYSKEGATTTLLSANPKVGDVIRIERIADTIFYKINNVQVRKKVVTGVSAVAMKLKANLRASCKLTDVGCSFINFGNSEINNYVETGATIIHSSGTGVANGKIMVKPKYGGTKTYTWSPSLKTGSTLDSLTAGQYTLTAMDSLLNKSQFTFNVGNKINWTNLYKASFRNDTLSSGVTAGFFGSAISKNTLEPNTDGWFEFAVTALYATSRDYFIGFTDSLGPDPENHDYIDNGMYYWGQVKYLYAKENTAEPVINYNPNVYDILRMQRVGNVISYMINGVSVRTLTVTGISQKRLKIWANLGTNVQLINVGASFMNRDSISFPNYVKVTPVVKHSSGPGINNGSVKVTPKLPFANTYSWSPTGATTNTIGSLGYGQYKVTVKDSLANASSYYYNVGYKAQWTNLDYCNVYGDSLVSYISSNYFSSASSKNTLKAGENGWMEFPIEKITGQSYYIGFLDSLSPIMGPYSDIDYGINFSSSNKYLYYYENGSIAVLYKNPNPGDLIKIERIGNIINYKINNVTLRTLTVTGLSSKALKIKANIQNADYLARVGCSFYATDSTGFKNFIGVDRTIKHSSGQGIADGSASIAPKIAGTYTYSWNPGGATTSSVTGMLARTYTATIKDSEANTTPNDCNVGYKVNWTSLSQCFFRNDTLKGTGPNNTYNGNAYSKNILPAGQNGWVEYVVKSYPANATYIGFTDSASTGVTTLTELSYGINIPAFSRAINYYEGGSSNLLFSYLRPGDVLRLERSGNNIYYKINGAIIRTVTGASIGPKVLKLKARLQYNNDLVNVGCSFASCTFTMSAGSTQTITCANPSVVLTGTTSLSGASYTWSPGSITTSSASVSTAGTYSLLVKNSTGECAGQATVVVVEPFSMSSVITNYENDTLPGEVQLCIKGGTQPYNIVWNGQSIPPYDSIYSMVMATGASLLIDTLTLKHYLDSVRVIKNHKQLVPGVYPATVYAAGRDSLKVINVVGSKIVWELSKGMTISTSQIPEFQAVGNRYIYGTGESLVQSGSFYPGQSAAYAANLISMDYNNYIQYSVPNMADSLDVGLTFRKLQMDSIPNDSVMRVRFMYRGATIKIKFAGIEIYTGSRSAGDVFTISNDTASGTVKFYKNSTLLVQDTILSIFKGTSVPADERLLVGVVMGRTGAALNNLVIISNPRYMQSTVKGIVSDVSCENSCSGKIDVTGIVLRGGLVQPLKYELFDLNDPSAPGIVSPIIYTGNGNHAIFEELCAGSYEIFYTAIVTRFFWASPLPIGFSYPVTVSSRFDVAYKPDWTNKVNISVSPTDNSLTKTSALYDWDAGASSLNILKSSESGWIEWSASPSQKISAIGFSDVDADQTINTINYSIGYIRIGLGLWGTWRLYLKNMNNTMVGTLNASGGILGNYSDKDLFRLEKNGTDILLKINGQVVDQFNGITPSDFILDASLKLMNGTIDHPRASFGCRVTEQYAVLDKKLDGGFYTPTNGKLLFKYDEEYEDNDRKLTFNIYNKDNVIIMSNTSLPSTSTPLVRYGDNRYMISLIKPAYLVPGKTMPADNFYILEVINEKNEKWYLRFKK